MQDETSCHERWAEAQSELQLLMFGEILQKGVSTREIVSSRDASEFRRCILKWVIIKFRIRKLVHNQSVLKGAQSFKKIQEQLKNSELSWSIVHKPTASFSTIKLMSVLQNVKLGFFRVFSMCLCLHGHCLRGWITGSDLRTGICFHDDLTTGKISSNSLSSGSRRLTDYIQNQNLDKPHNHFYLLAVVALSDLLGVIIRWLNSLELSYVFVTPKLSSRSFISSLGVKW